MRNIILGLIAGAIVFFITKSAIVTIVVGIAFMIFFFIGARLLNPQKYIFNNMILEARKTTGKVLEKVNQQCYDNNILKKSYSEIVGIDILKLPKNFQDEIDKYLTCIEGLCYIIGLNHSKFPPNSMIMRCIQFITLIDKSLYGYGIKPCSLEKKIGLYKATNLYDAYLNDSSAFYTSENKKEDIISDNNENIQVEKKQNEGKKDKIINIKARNNFPPSDLDIIEIYNELMNAKRLSFELIWDKFQNIQCFNDVVLYENIEIINDSVFSGSVSYFLDNNGNSFITYFSCLPNKIIDYFLFQLILENFSIKLYHKYLITNSDDIQNHKEKLKQLKPDSNHAFLYGPYPYYYEKENKSYIQAFIGCTSGEVNFVDICILQGKKYEINNTIVIQNLTTLF
jgi:hypothetical protein